MTSGEERVSEDIREAEGIADLACLVPADASEALTPRDGRSGSSSSVSLIPWYPYVRLDAGGSVGFVLLAVAIFPTTDAETFKDCLAV